MGTATYPQTVIIIANNRPWMGGCPRSSPLGAVDTAEKKPVDSAVGAFDSAQRERDRKTGDWLGARDIIIFPRFGTCAVPVPSFPGSVS